MQGQLAVSGSMPFLSAVQMQGALPSIGQATVDYGCGDGVAITQETGNPCGPNAKFAGGLTTADLALCGTNAGQAAFDQPSCRHMVRKRRRHNAGDGDPCGPNA
ncbi:chorion class B protein M3A5-like [Cydia fagiglandana]|uniref:chorion class B protein M3A5-like n=1 Tax=Cydia fagiglandana TaxID=1458189 RepID=UPI002FEE35EE